MTKNFIAQAVVMPMALLSGGAMAQQGPKLALPLIAGAAVPLYPPLARVARVEGVVHVKITTDGHRVTAAYVEDGHKLLAAAAEQNARTWQFSTHEPVTFTVTYRYKLDPKLQESSNPTVVLRFPTEVEISMSRPPPLHGAIH